MARTKQTARKSTGGKAPRKQLATKMANINEYEEVDAYGLLPVEQYKDQSINNSSYIPAILSNFQQKYPAHFGVLQAHPIYYALNHEFSVATVYVQQFWNTLQYVQTAHPPHFRGTINRTTVTFTAADLRRILRLPPPINNQYDPILPKRRVMQDLVNLGYSQPSANSSDYNQAYMARPWACFFTVINRCLTAKANDWDKAAIVFLGQYHAICYHRNIDFAASIFKNMVEVYNVKKKTKFVPFPRFLKSIIHDALERNPNIPKRLNATQYPNCAMSFMKADLGVENLEGRPVLLSLLNLIPEPYSDEIISYRSQHYPAMAQPIPVVPNPGQVEPIPSEGPRVVPSAETVQPLVRRPRQRRSAATSSTTTTTTPPTPITTAPPTTSTLHLHDSSSEGTESDDDDNQGGAEYIMLARSVSHTTPIHITRATLVSTHVLSGFPESSRPLLASSQTDSSVSSLQETVELTYREQPHNLPTSPFEAMGIESSEPSPSLTTSFVARTLSLDPFESFPSLQSRTQITPIGLCEPIRTPVVTSFDVPRGSGGSPVRATSLSTLSAGHTVLLSESTAVTTERLSDPGLIVTTASTSTSTSFVTQEQLELALQQIQQQIVPQQPAPQQAQQVLLPPTGMSLEWLLTTFQNVPDYGLQWLQQARAAQRLGIPLAVVPLQSAVPNADIQRLEERLRETERELALLRDQSTCREVSVLKRKHDDPDSDSHEGEKRLRLGESLSSAYIEIEDQQTESTQQPSSDTN